VYTVHRQRGITNGQQGSDERYKDTLKHVEVESVEAKRGVGQWVHRTRETDCRAAPTHIYFIIGFLFPLTNRCGHLTGAKSFTLSQVWSPPIG